MYIYIYIYIYTHTHTYLQTHIHTRTCRFGTCLALNMCQIRLLRLCQCSRHSGTCIHTCDKTDICACIHASPYAFVHKETYRHACGCLFLHVGLFVYVYMCVCLCTFMCGCLLLCMCSSVCACVWFPSVCLCKCI